MPTMAPNNVEATHEYHAEAHVLSGELQRPIAQRIEKHAPLLLRDSRDNHLTRYIDKISIEGLVAFARGETRVSGTRSLKHNGWVTVSTSILEGLNVFEVITADRLVSQVSTDHAFVNGHFPRVTFLGSQFTNFRVSGFEPELTIDLSICGDIPPNGRSYFQYENFLDKVREQTRKVVQKMAKPDGPLPAGLKDQYDRKLAYVETLIKNVDAPSQGTHEPLTCSLVQSIEKVPIPGLQIFGNVMVIPEFGTVTLGEIELSDEIYPASPKPCVAFELKSIQVKMGCVGDGTVTAGAARGNGQTYP